MKRIVNILNVDKDILYIHLYTSSCSDSSDEMHFLIKLIFIGKKLLLLSGFKLFQVLPTYTLAYHIGII